MEIQRLLAVPLHETVRAVPPVEADQTGRVDQQHVPALHAGGVERLHAQQPLHQLRAQPLPAGALDMSHEVVEGVMDRQRRLRGLGQAIEVGQDPRTAVAEVVIELAPRAELQQLQGNPPPCQETP